MIDYRDLEDRIASLERTTRNIGVGQELVVGSLHALNTVTAADVLMKRPIYDIRAFGAVGDNSADDTTPIQDAIDAAHADSAGGVVLVPPLGSGANDRYKTTSALDWKGGVCFLGAGYYSRISAHVSNSAFPIIQSDTTMQLGIWMKGLTLGFEDYYDDVLAKCIFFRTQGADYPEMFTIEDVTLRNGYYGYYDSSGSFLGHLRRVWAYKNRVGFYKSGGGTGHHFDTCYAQGKNDKAWDMRGFDISSGVSYVLEACSMDNYYSDTDAIARFADNYSLTINGFVMEDDKAETNGNSIVQFDDNNSVHVTGMKDVSCVINAAAGDNTRLITVHEDRVHFSGCELGGGTTVNAASGATAEGYAIDITGAADDVCRVTVTASAIVNPTVGTNTPTVYAVRLGTAVNTIQLTLDNVLDGDILNANANKIFDTSAAIATNYIHIQDQKANNTDGGTFTTGAWRTRVLNTEVADTGGDASVASNQITLQPGTYRCLISCPAYRTDRHKARLKNVTDNSTILMGTSEYSDNADDFASTRSFIAGRFTIAAAKVLEVQHYCQTTYANLGFGVPSNFSVIEVYTDVQLWKELG